jgi:hypothetical protein
VFPRPRIRLPIWAAFAIPAAAYVVRSAMRGFDFRPDMPTDALILVVLLVVVGLVAWSRSQSAVDDESDPDTGDDSSADAPGVTSTDDTTKGPAA